MALTKVTNSVVSSGSATDGYVLTADGSGGSAWEASAGGVDGIVSSADATAITIDSSENVGIGTSSVGAKLEVYGTADSSPQTSNGILKINSTTTNAIIFGTLNSSPFGTYIQSGGSSTYPLILNPNGGNVGIGTSSPAAKLNVSGDIAITGANRIYNTNSTLYLDAASSENIILRPNGGTEAMRLDSSGRLLVGTTTPTNSIAAIEGKSSNGVSGYATGTYGASFLAYGSSGNGIAWYGANAAGGQTSQINRNGDMLNSNNSYGALSDVKLKENIVDANPQLNKLKQVQVRNYNLIGEELRQIGMVAQELETVYPNLITESIDRDENAEPLETTTKTIKYSVFIPILIKAIQEQQVLIEAQATTITNLTTRIETLENA